MSKLFFKIQCKTNMHVGSGEANYGVVDNLVQRDATFHYPTIHASSLKGAIKEFCHHKKVVNMVDIFGSEKDETGKSKHESTKVGSYKFFDANLLAIPVRCDKRAFVHITCPLILKDLAETLDDRPLKTDLIALAEIFDGNSEKAFAFNKTLDDTIIEDFEIKAKYDGNKAKLFTEEIKKLFENNEVVIVNDDYLKTLTNDLHLPVIARNYLENGESKNLWYEQVVPRLSIFWSWCILPEEDKLFKPVLFQKENLIQIGANGSIGYGYCNFSEISK